jgi:hypothetical protein
MAVWYSFVCESCGHGGLTQDRYSYENGSQPCPRCGSIEFSVEEPDTVGYPELDELEAGGSSL